MAIDFFPCTQRGTPHGRPRDMSFRRNDKNTIPTIRVSEPAKLLYQEAVEIEREIPAEDILPIERIEPNDRDAPACKE
jgi:hypothetical protein